MKPKTGSDREIAHITDVHFEVQIAVAPPAVWQALTSDISKWWPAAFYCGAGKGPHRFRLEARPGGLMWEDHANGDGLHWGTVINVQTNVRLEIQGCIAPAWGGPALWFGTFELEASAGGTRLRFSESAFGRVTEAGMLEKTKGWRFLFDGVLRAQLEGTPAPQWPG